MQSEEPRPPLEEVLPRPPEEQPPSPVGLSTLLLAGALVFVGVAAGGFLAVPRLLDRGDPTSPAPLATAP